MGRGEEWDVRLNGNFEFMGLGECNLHTCNLIFDSPGEGFKKPKDSLTLVLDLTPN